MGRIQRTHLVGIHVHDGLHGIDAEELGFVCHVISLSLEFYIQAHVDVEIAFVVFAVGHAPESVYPEQA